MSTCPWVEAVDPSRPTAFPLVTYYASNKQGGTPDCTGDLDCMQIDYRLLALELEEGGNNIYITKEIPVAAGWTCVTTHVVIG